MTAAHPLRLDPIAEAGDHWRRCGWESAAAGMEFVTSVQRVQQLLVAEIERTLKPHRLTFARYEVLMLLTFSRTGTLPIGKIGERLQVHPASATNAVDRLEVDGFVERVRNPDDGRSVLVAITGIGRTTAERATAQLNTSVFEAVPLDDEQVTDAIAILRDVRRAFGDFPP